VSQHGWTCPECGKVCYLTRRAARRAASQLPLRPGSKLRAYPCGQYWHLTSQPTGVLTGWREWEGGRQ
jgi:hypothetical protein